MRPSLVVLVVLSFSLADAASAQTVWEFTTAGQEGNTGPSQAQLDAAYSGTNLDGAVTSVGGIQEWIVGFTAHYQIEAWGGQGYGAFGGRGAYVSGEFDLMAGETIRILVGQKGAPYLNYPATTYNHQYGGGGGSFVTRADNTPLVVAGGGGGSHASSFVSAGDGQAGESGAAGANASTVGAGGTLGLGGQQAVSADAGAGLLGDGDGAAGGQAFVNGGLGGSDEGTGGFGGGGGTSSWNNYRGGGGGGYSGGGGANNGGSCCPVGGGGGSYNAGGNPVVTSGVQLGDGLVRITLLGIAFSKAFVPDLVPVGQATTLTFTVDNSPFGTGASSLDFTDDLPAGMLVADPSNAATTCIGGTITAVPNSGTITYTGGSVDPMSLCTVTVDVVTTATGIFLNTSGLLTSSEGVHGAASATLTVPPPPTFSKAFVPDTVNLGASSTLTLMIDNTASPAAAAGLDFTDPLPPGVLVAALANASTTCTGGTLTATPGSGSITYSGGSVGAPESCTVSVDVTGVSGGAQLNTTGNLTSSSGSSGPATATLTVNAPPTFAKVFSPAFVGLGGVSTLTFTIDNSASTVLAGGLSFVDDLPDGTIVATPSNAGTTCTGGTLTAAAGSGSITYGGGSVAAMAACTVTVDVAGLSEGGYLNTTGSLTSTSGNSGTASDLLTVDGTPPGEVGDLVSTSHTVGSPSSDPSIDLSWTPATGAVGYGVLFDGTASPSCEEIQDTTGTTFTSPALADGDWYAHVCAVDEVGNWGTSVTAGPYTVDTVPPRVVATLAVAGGAFSEGHETDLPVTALAVRFSESMHDPAGNGGPDDVTNPDNYLLVRPGLDGTWETTSCATGLAGTDVGVPVEAVSYETVDDTAWLELPGDDGLVPGSYRLLACGTTSLHDEAGHELDGDGNGVGGDDFVRTFRILVRDELSNPNLDHDDADWVFEGPVSAGAGWEPSDSDAAPVSGSVRLQGTMAPGDLPRLGQCLAVPGDRALQAAARLLVTSTVPGAPQVGVSVEEFTSADCAGTPSQVTLGPELVLGDTGSTWAVPPPAELVTAASTGSIRVSVVVEPGGAVDLDVSADVLYLREFSPALFADGFESGDTSGWSASVP